MIRVFLILLIVLLPVGAGAQVEFEPVKQPPGDISPKEQRRMEMLEQVRGRKAPAEVVERRRNRLKKVAQMRSNPEFIEEFKKYHRRLAMIIRIHELAKQSGNAALAEKSQELMKAEVKRHTRVMKAQMERPATEDISNSETDDSGEGSDP